MKKNLIVFFMILLSLKSFCDGSQDKTLKLDVDTAVSLALANNLQLKAERLKFQSKEWAMFTSWNTFIPDMSISSTLYKTNLHQEKSVLAYPSVELAAGTGLYGVAKVQYDSPAYLWGLYAQFNLALNLNASMVFNVKKTVLDWQSGKINLNIAKRQLEKNIKTSYYKLIIMQENIKLYQEAFKSAKLRVDISEKNVAVGLIADVERMKAEVDYENLKPKIEELQNNYIVNSDTFKQVLGIVDTAEIELTSSLVTQDKRSFDWEILAKDYLENKDEIKAAKTDIQNLMNQRNIYISQLSPTFSIGFSADPHFQRDPTKDSWFSVGSSEENARYNYDNWKQSQGSFYFTITQPLSSLVPFSTAQMQIVQSSFGVKQLQLALENTRQQAKNEIKSIVMKLEKSESNIEAIKKNIELAQKTYKITESLFKLGTKDLLALEEASDAVDQAKLNLLAAESDYTIGLLELEYALNVKIADIVK
jgi:outer membrane protein TolC